VSHIEKSSVVHCTPAAAWEFLSHRENSALVVPGLVRVWDIKPAEACIGQTWQFEFKLLGIVVPGSARMTALDTGRELQFQTSNSVESRWTYSIAPEGKDARVKISVDYTLPDTIWGRLKDRVAVSRIHENQIEEILVNLEAKLGA
jgi:hypothetical protein